MSANAPIKPGVPDLDANGQSLGLPWSVGGTLDIASPVIFDMRGRPRLFAHADVGYTYDLDDPVVSKGDPGAPPAIADVPIPTATSIENAGASVRAEAVPLVLSGGIGTVFSFEAFDRGFRVRPTLEWMYRRDTMKTTFGTGVTDALTGQRCVPSCSTVYTKSQTEKGFHSVGPGIEVEADVGRFGEFVVGWYSSFRALYIVGDRKANLKDTASWKRSDGLPSTRPDAVFATEYEREPWHYRFGMGIRILWSPEE